MIPVKNDFVFMKGEHFCYAVFMFLTPSVKNTISLLKISLASRNAIADLKRFLIPKAVRE